MNLLTHFRIILLTCTARHYAKPSSPRKNSPSSCTLLAILLAVALAILFIEVFSWYTSIPIAHKTNSQPSKVTSTAFQSFSPLSSRFDQVQPLQAITISHTTKTTPTPQPVVATTQVVSTPALNACPAGSHNINTINDPVCNADPTGCPYSEQTPIDSPKCAPPSNPNAYTPWVP